jgi:hypothetical protein
MWQEDNPVFSSLPDAPSTRFKHWPPASSRGSKSSQLMIEHHCGSEKIQMTLNENGDLWCQGYVSPRRGSSLSDLKEL